jgi:hypothetical protein
MFAALRSAGLQFLPLFSPEKQGRDGCAGALFAASVGVASAARRGGGLAERRTGEGDDAVPPKCEGDDTARSQEATLAALGSSCPGVSLPARSLRGRPASLRTVPDSAGCLLRKRLIWHGLLVMRPVISGVEPIFLPALREPGQSGSRWRRGRQAARRRLLTRVSLPRSSSNSSASFSSITPPSCSASTIVTARR